MRDGVDWVTAVVIIKSSFFLLLIRSSSYPVIHIHTRRAFDSSRPNHGEEDDGNDVNSKIESSLP